MPTSKECFMYGNPQLPLANRTPQLRVYLLQGSIPLCCTLGGRAQILCYTDTWLTPGTIRSKQLFMLIVLLCWVWHGRSLSTPLLARLQDLMLKCQEGVGHLLRAHIGFVLQHDAPQDTQTAGAQQLLAQGVRWVADAGDMAATMCHMQLPCCQGMPVGLVRLLIVLVLIHLVLVVMALMLREILLLMLIMLEACMGVAAGRATADVVMLQGLVVIITATI